VVVVDASAASRVPVLGDRHDGVRVAVGVVVSSAGLFFSLPGSGVQLLRGRSSRAPLRTALVSGAVFVVSLIAGLVVSLQIPDQACEPPEETATPEPVREETTILEEIFALIPEVTTPEPIGDKEPEEPEPPPKPAPAPEPESEPKPEPPASYRV